MIRLAKRILSVFTLLLIGVGGVVFFFCQNHSSPGTSISISLKVVNDEGRVLSGFSVLDESKLLGRVDAFGEWKGTLKKKSNKPFFLLLKSYLREEVLSKRVEIEFKNLEGKGYASHHLVTFPRESLVSHGHSSFIEREKKKASLHKLNLESLFISFASNDKKKLEGESYHESLLKEALENEVLSKGLKLDFDSPFQLFIQTLDPVERKNHRIYVSFPYGNRKISFDSSSRGLSSKDWARKVLAEIKKRVAYPYQVMRKEGRWYVLLQESSQGSFWNTQAPKLLSSHLTSIEVSSKGVLKEGEYLHALSPSTGNFCKFPDRDSCVLFSKPIQKP